MWRFAGIFAAKDREIADLRAKLKQAEDARDLYFDDLNITKTTLHLAEKALAAKDAELAESNRELDEAVENLKALGQQQMDDFKAHKAEVDLYRKAVEPVKECREKWRGCQHAQVVMKERDCEAWEAVKGCIRILGEAGNERD